MRKLLFLPALLVACCLACCLAGCQSADVKVLIGATAITSAGAPPIQDAVIVVAGHTIRAAGIRKDVPIPQDSERTSLTGKWIIPAGNGRIAPGEPANLLILDHAPPGDPSRRLTDGNWN